ncbi:Dolichyl-diphosphooligosaccharide-protein glycosyltransferase subunit dad1 [Coemansia sp. RSA 2440]|nr:Dolichyl-diphosphooligosaccharide-protein glycosyltransferase subunit dad1 [Coemansia sp. RSA 1938]KAJ2444795.1 Dolichyl-diphosphooligosaccharide-protein glycosyltransferase subunit dad1 [Coemansia sp. RSA 2440]KAJ2554748.1 Dolichyl-diphosphooligosaccharide-protein glycosyltransferase subunit dad1 [Coemansia sp. RSA 1878]
MSAVLSALVHDYAAHTPLRLRAIDAYMAFCAVIALVQLVYCVLVGSFPYNAFLAGFGSAAACFVFAAALRIKSDERNAHQFSGSPEGAFAEFVFCHIVLHFIVANFLG